MKQTRPVMLAMATELDSIGQAFMDLGALRDGMQCLREANDLRERAPAAPKIYQPQWMIDWCIWRGYNPERFINMWNGVK